MNPTLKSYILGFVISLLCTLSAYWVAISPTLTSKSALGVVITLAFLQLITQLIFFLHLGSEKGPRWNVFILFTAFIGIFILVVGSLWIMNHLNYSMTPQDMNTNIMNMEGMHE